MNPIAALFSRKPKNAEAPKQPTKEELIAELLALPNLRTHDLRFRYWGHNITKCGDTHALWTSPRLEKGDKIITESGLFVAYDVRPCGNPPDMVFADFFKIGEADSIPDATGFMEVIP
jgi:hypothetical protein